jgi:hypothetical protein
MGSIAGVNPEEEVAASSTSQEVRYPWHELSQYFGNHFEGSAVIASERTPVRLGDGWCNTR